MFFLLLLCKPCHPETLHIKTGKGTFFRAGKVCFCVFVLEKNLLWTHSASIDYDVCRSQFYDVCRSQLLTSKSGLVMLNPTNFYVRDAIFY